MISDVIPCELEKAEATLRIENFNAAFRVASGPFKKDLDYNEANVITSKQVLRCGVREFRFGVAWRLDKELNVTDESTIGLFVLNPNSGTMAAALEMTLVNRQPAASITP